MMLCAGDCARDELGDQPGLGTVLGNKRVERKAAAGGGRSRAASRECCTGCATLSDAA
jgi:hypothetical protein